MVETELVVGGFTLAAVLTALQGVMYGSFPIPDKYKPLSSAILGIGLGIFTMWGSGIAFTPTNITTYAVGGFMVAATSSGIYSWVKSRKGEV